MPVPFDRSNKAIKYNIIVIDIIIKIENSKFNSSIPKKPYLNELTIYAIGLNREMVCHIVGNKSIAKNVPPRYVNGAKINVGTILISSQLFA